MDIDIFSFGSQAEASSAAIVRLKIRGKADELDKYVEYICL